MTKAKWTYTEIAEATVGQDHYRIEHVSGEDLAKVYKNGNLIGYSGSVDAAVMSAEDGTYDAY